MLWSSRVNYDPSSAAFVKIRSDLLASCAPQSNLFLLSISGHSPPLYNLAQRSGNDTLNQFRFMNTFRMQSSHRMERTEVQYLVLSHWFLL